MLPLLHILAVGQLVSPAIYEAKLGGLPVVLRVDPWCDNSLRVRIVPAASATFDDLPGAFGAACHAPGKAGTSAVHNAFGPNTMTNGALTAKWSEAEGLAFYTQVLTPPCTEL